MDSMTSDDDTPPDRLPPSQFTPQSQEIISQRGLTCLICHLVLSQAVQVTCGARFCESCLDQLLERREPAVCPLCETENPEEKEHITRSEVQPDNFCRNQVKKLRIKCAYYDKECPWTGLFSQTQTYREHVQQCSFGQIVECECGKHVAASELATHKETECSYHQALGPAKEVGLPCVVCNHPAVNSGDHIKQLCQRVRDVEADAKQEVKEVHKAKESEDGLTQRAEIQQSSLDAAAAGSHSLPDPGANGRSPSPKAAQYEALLNKFKANTSLITVLFTEIKTCSHQIVTTQDETKNDLENVKQRLTILERLVADIQGKIPRLEGFMADLPMISTKGRLTWRIDNVEAKREDAQRGINPALYSPPFSTEEAGYKMCARLYLNGDGIGKDSHVSLFFVLMKGKYDAILTWPFSRRVTMSLLDQSGNGNHVQEKFRPDPNSSSFQRPRSEMNIATGCPRFIAKGDLDRRKQLYIREGAMFIQVVVD